MAFTLFRIHYFPSDRKAYYKCSSEFETHRRCEIVAVSAVLLRRVTLGALLRTGGCPAGGGSHVTAVSHIMTRSLMCG